MGAWVSSWRRVCRCVCVWGGGSRAQEECGAAGSLGAGLWDARGCAGVASSSATACQRCCGRPGCWWPGPLEHLTGREVWQSWRVMLTRSAHTWRWFACPTVASASSRPQQNGAGRRRASSCPPTPAHHAHHATTSPLQPTSEWVVSHDQLAFRLRPEACSRCLQLWGGLDLLVMEGRACAGAIQGPWSTEQGAGGRLFRSKPRTPTWQAPLVAGCEHTSSTMHMSHASGCHSNTSSGTPFSHSPGHWAIQPAETWQARAMGPALHIQGKARQGRQARRRAWAGGRTEVCAAAAYRAPRYICNTYTRSAHWQLASGNQYKCRRVASKASTLSVIWPWQTPASYHVCWCAGAPPRPGSLHRGLITQPWLAGHPCRRGMCTT